MAQIRINIPDEYFNRLNNFYIDNFGYEIHTPIQNFIREELERCGDYSTEKPKKVPIPSIVKDSGGKYPYFLTVRYPDGSKSMISVKSFELAMEMWNEWSKYSFDKKNHRDVALKFKHENDSRVMGMRIKGRNGKFRVRCRREKSDKYFGSYSTVEDAVIVREFLTEHNWDMKYHISNVMQSVEGIHQYNYSDWMLKVAKGEIEYDTSE